MCSTLTRSCTVNLSSTHVLKIESTEISDMKDDLQKFWDLETLGIKEDETSVYDKFSNDITFTRKRYQVKLPFKDNQPMLPDNYTVALRRLTTTNKKLKNQPEILEQYDGVIREQLHSGVVEMVPQDQIPPPGDVHYLPHRTVVRLDRETTKCTCKRAIEVSLYVDDDVSGKGDVDSAFKLSNKIRLCLKSGGFNMRKWSSNSESLLRSLEQDEAFSDDFEKSSGPRVEEEDEGFSKSVFKQSAEKEQKVLGMLWNPTQDELIYDLNKTLGDVDAQPETRRLILSTAIRFFDPLGLIAPVILPFKMMFQKLCKGGKGWDELIDAERNHQWLATLSDLRQAGRVSFKRCYAKGLNGDKVKSVQLPDHARIGQKSYEAVVYMRVEYEARVECQLLRVTVLVELFIEKLKKTRCREGTEEDFTKLCRQAEMMWIRHVQQEILKSNKFTQMKSSLALYQDEEGVLRCQGRIGMSSRFPILLPRSQYFTMLVILKCHDQVMHNGVAETLVQVRSRYWIVKARQTLKSIFNKCALCKKLEGRPYGTPPTP
ncbi:uncharacterized protein [Montipora foliosa]|uniref:uncharacterized protein n=1 Tax=Montipora foliosa TaxID=591990 RepID=UPI0035F1EBA6